MFLLKSLYGKVWSDTNSTELAQISTGQLYLVRPGSIQGSRECLFNNAMVTVRRSTQEFNFQLVVTRVFEEGEEQLLDEDEETEDERSFLIGDQLEFHVGTFEGEPAFRWRDLQGDPSDFYEFVAIGTNHPTSSFFETCIYKAMWERKYSRSAEDASDNDLKEFVLQEDGRPAQEAISSTKKSKAKAIQSEKASGVQPAHVQSKPANITPERGTPQSGNVGNTLLSAEAELYWWDADKAAFEWQGAVEALIIQPDVFQFAILVCEDGQRLLYHPISSDNNGQFTELYDSFTWNNLNNEGHQSSWCLKLSSAEQFQAWRGSYTKALYESLNRSSWSKIKTDEQRYIMDSHNADVDMRDAEEEEQVKDVLDVDRSDSQSESEFEDEMSTAISRSKIKEPDSSEDEAPEFPQGKNEQLTVGFNKDRSYVVRGNKIGVFKATNQGKMEHHGTLSQVKNTKGKAFVPKKMMLHDQDNAMILMDPGEQNSLYKLDIERGKVVEEWKIDDNVPVMHIAPENKFAQTQPERTILGASGNALFRIDPRLSGKKLVDSEFKQYVSKNKFSGLATTEAGQVAVASEKGDLRLFDKVGKNAKTALPAMGDPIIGVDVTKDGRWLVATCRTYLLVIDTQIGEGRYAGQLGFDRSFPADAKPEPKRLRLQNAHVQYMGSGISFSPARFNIGEDQEESAIVTSTGNYVIAWDFKAIKKGKYDKYEIRKYQDTVVQDQFKYGNPNDIVVALQNNVVMINKKQLRSPAQATTYGRKPSSSKSKIVNSPF